MINLYENNTRPKSPQASSWVPPRASAQEQKNCANIIPVALVPRVKKM